MKVTNFAEVDFVLLRQANDLLLKWANRQKEPVTKNCFVKWCIRLWQNPELCKKQLPINYRSAFAKDCVKMFYAADVEEVIINQYYAMIFHVMNKLRIPDDSRDEYLSIGMNTIRYAVWQFRNHKIRCNFTTWCHNNIFMRIKGEFKKSMAKITRRNRSVRLATDIDANYKLHDYAIVFPNHDMVEEEDTQNFFDKVVEKADLNESEKFMIDCFMKRHDKIYMEGKKAWYQEYLEKYACTSVTGKLTREAVRLRLMRLQKKLWRAWYAVLKKPAPDFEYHSVRLAI